MHNVLDVYGVIKNNSTTIDDSLNAINGTLLSPIDPDGNFFGVMTDFMGHGTVQCSIYYFKRSLKHTIFTMIQKNIL